MASICSQYSCSVCGLHFNGPVPYKAHMGSLRHMRKVEFHKEIKIDENVQNDSNLEKRVSKEPNASEVRFCDVCNIYVTGIIPWQQHIEGQKHLKKCQVVKIMKSLKITATDDPSQSDTNQVSPPPCYTRPPSDCVTPSPFSNIGSLSDHASAPPSITSLPSSHAGTPQSITNQPSNYGDTAPSHASLPSSHTGISSSGSSLLSSNTTLPTSHSSTLSSHKCSLLCHSSLLPGHTTLLPSSTVTPSSHADTPCSHSSLLHSSTVTPSSHAGSPSVHRSLLSEIKLKEYMDRFTPLEDTTKEATNQDYSNGKKSNVSETKMQQEIFVQAEEQKSVSKSISSQNSESAQSLCSNTGLKDRTYSLHVLFRKFYCEQCNIQCNGPVPYQNHLSSYRHLHHQYLQTLKNEDETTYLTPANLSNFSNPVGISVKNAGVPVKKTKPPKKDDLLLNGSREDLEIFVIGGDEPVDLAD